MEYHIFVFFSTCFKHLKSAYTHAQMQTNRMHRPPVTYITSLFFVLFSFICLLSLFQCILDLIFIVFFCVFWSFTIIDLILSECYGLEMQCLCQQQIASKIRKFFVSQIFYGTKLTTGRCLISTAYTWTFSFFLLENCWHFSTILKEIGIKTLQIKYV